MTLSTTMDQLQKSAESYCYISPQLPVSVCCSQTEIMKITWPMPFRLVDTKSLQLQALIVAPSETTKT